MNVRGDVISVHDVKRWATGALVVLALVRALIPLGFMPDLRSAALGDFKLIICSSGGLQALAPDDGNPHSGEPASEPPGHNQPCAFAIALADTARAQDHVIVKPAATHMRVRLPAQIVLPPARAGPALGSRAPPFIS